MKYQNSRTRLLCLIALLVSIAGLNAQFAGGSGTLADPYQIQTPEHLHNIRNQMQAHYAQIADIDLEYFVGVDGAGYNNGSGWLPIGTETPGLRFNGTYSGNGYVIKHLMINRPNEHYIGLFGYLGAGSGIRDLGLIDASVTGSMQVGGIAGGSENTFIQNCFVEGNISGNAIVGGLVANASTGTVVQLCYSKGTVSTVAGNSLGGLLAVLGNYSTLSDSYSQAVVNGVGEYVGGLVGVNVFNSSISHCYSSGLVQGPGDDVGGLVGQQAYQSTTENSYWDMQSSGRSYSAGGIGRTTAQMLQTSTYSGWAFPATWMQIEGESYPYFHWQSLVAPLYGPTPGIYNAPVVVTLSHPIPGASIYYRCSTNASAWSEWLLYSGEEIGVAFSSTMDFEAYATKPAHIQSSVSIASFSVLASLAEPTVDPSPGTYQDSVTVSILHTDPFAEIYYTTDGTDPTPQSILYTTPLELTESTIIKAQAYREGWAPSQILTAVYNLEPVSANDAVQLNPANQLRSAYPNPFNPSTTLSFCMSADGYAQLQIYNLKGSKIRTLVEGVLSSGLYQYQWDGRDDSGRTAASGIYFYSLVTQQGTETKKMLMLK